MRQSGLEVSAACVSARQTGRLAGLRRRPARGEPAVQRPVATGHRSFVRFCFVRICPGRLGPEPKPSSHWSAVSRTWSKPCRSTANPIAARKLPIT